MVERQRNTKKEAEPNFFILLRTKYYTYTCSSISNAFVNI